MEHGIPSGVWNCRIDGSGRIVIPHLVRTEKSLKIGDEVSICKIAGEFIIRRKDEMMEHLLELFRTDLPDDVSLVDELLAERRAEAAREEVGH